MPTPHDLLRTEHQGDVTIARITAERLDSSVAEPFGRALSALASTPEGGQLRLDLGAVRYLSSEPLGKLIALHKALCAANRELLLDNVQPDVYEIFAVTKLTKFLNVSCPEGPPDSCLRCSA